MAILKSGASSDQLTIGAVSKAARVTLYDDAGISLSQRAAYRAASIATSTVVSGTAPFFTFYGSAQKRAFWGRSLSQHMASCQDHITKPCIS